MMNSEGYFMGVDPYGYDNTTAVAIVMKKIDNTNINLVAIYEGRSGKDFVAEVKRLSEFYKVKPEWMF